VRLTADYFDNPSQHHQAFRKTTPFGCVPGHSRYFCRQLLQHQTWAAARRKSCRRSAHHTLAQRKRNYTYDSTRTLSAPNTFDPNYIPGSRLAAPAGELRKYRAECGVPADELEFFRVFHGPTGRLPRHGLTVKPRYARLDSRRHTMCPMASASTAASPNLADKKFKDVLASQRWTRNFALA